ncbi:MAG: cytochrome c nitrite reductase small subunit [Bacteroidales bacterium]|nr:cytochrome c nitrite reductase small subunit [Bacteroidales bacterium]
MKLLKSIIPPDSWKLPVIVLSGIFAGLFAYSFYISKAPSYLSDKPETCVNCHIMAPQYATWSHSAHREVTNCNDCHVPHNNIFNKYYFKAKDGLRHATMFTLRLEPQVIFIHEAGQKVVQNNCIRCHTDKITDSKMLALTQGYHQYRTERQCWECHRETPHGRVNSLSSVPNSKVPLPESPVPEWINRLTKN